MLNHVSKLEKEISKEMDDALVVSKDSKTSGLCIHLAYCYYYAPDGIKKIFRLLHISKRESSKRISRNRSFFSNSYIKYRFLFKYETSVNF